MSIHVNTKINKFSDDVMNLLNRKTGLKQAYFCTEFKIHSFFIKH